MMQQPSAPKAVAIVSRGWKVSTAQRRIVGGVCPARRLLASAICSESNTADSKRAQDQAYIILFIVLENISQERVQPLPLSNSGIQLESECHVQNWLICIDLRY